MKEFIIVYVNNVFDSVKFYNLTVVGSSKKRAIDYFYKASKKDGGKFTLINIIEL